MISNSTVKRLKVHLFLQIHKTRKMCKTISSGSELPVKGFSSDSSGVRFNHFYWIIGGHTPCSGTLSTFLEWFDPAYGQGNLNSYLWSIKKRKWGQNTLMTPITHSKPLVLLL